MRLWRMMGQYDAETKAFEPVAGAAAPSPYVPDFSGTLVALRTIVGAAAATSLQEHVQWKLTCTTFVPNEVQAGSGGAGLRTAPAFQPAPIDWGMNQRVQSGVPIKIEARNLTADTPVTVESYLYGLFEVGRV